MWKQRKIPGFCYIEEHICSCHKSQIFPEFVAKIKIALGVKSRPTEECSTEIPEVEYLRTLSLQRRTYFVLPTSAIHYPKIFSSMKSRPLLLTVPLVMLGGGVPSQPGAAKTTPPPDTVKHSLQAPPRAARSAQITITPPVFLYIKISGSQPARAQSSLLGNLKCLKAHLHDFLLLFFQSKVSTVLCSYP